MTARVTLLCCALVLVLPGWSRAHPLAPSFLELVEEAGGTVRVNWKTSTLRPTGASLYPVLPDVCRPTGQPQLMHGDGFIRQSFQADCAGQSLVGLTVGVSGLAESKTNALLRVQLADGRSVRVLLQAEQSTLRVPERESRLAVLRGYVTLGVEHLLFGFDHLLFVLGLLFLVRDGRRLISTLTAFTLGHSATLSLAALGVVRFSPALIEIGIAFSIYVLGVELAREAPAPRSWLRRSPWSMSLAFGLLHGLGFAGALTQIGLPAGEVPLALFSFNLGVELGQLMVALPVVGLLQWSPRALRWHASGNVMRRAAAYTIGSLAAYWCLQRCAAWL